MSEADERAGLVGTIPALLRRSLGLEEVDWLVARQEADRLVLEKPEQIRQRLKDRIAQVPSERRLVEGLLTERREESPRESVGSRWCWMPRRCWRICSRNQAPRWSMGCWAMHGWHRAAQPFAWRSRLPRPGTAARPEGGDLRSNLGSAALGLEVQVLR